MRENKYNWKVGMILKYIGFLFVILLISSVSYASILDNDKNKIGDIGNSSATHMTKIIGQDGSSGIMNNSNNTSSSIAYSDIVAKSSTNSAAIPTSVSLGTIEGQVFEDLNANGIKDLEQAGLAGDEVILPGWKINLKGKDVSNKQVRMTTTTDSNGNYYFSGLNAGNYIVSEDLPLDWMQTSSSSYNINVMSDSDIYGQDFGNFHKGKITGGLTTVKNRISKIGEDPINKIFGIVAEWPPGSCAPRCSVKGHVEYRDNTTSLIVESIQINTVATTLDKRRGVITGLAKINGAGSYSFEIYVENDSENDLLDIKLPAYGYSNRIIVGKGNILLDN